MVKEPCRDEPLVPADIMWETPHGMSSKSPTPYQQQENPSLITQRVTCGHTGAYGEDTCCPNLLPTVKPRTMTVLLDRLMTMRSHLLHELVSIAWTSYSVNTVPYNANVNSMPYCAKRENATSATTTTKLQTHPHPHP